MRNNTAIRPSANHRWRVLGRNHSFCRTTNDENKSPHRNGDEHSAINLYLQEIGEVELLTPQEEIELAARIKRGDKKAREHMIRANLRLVVRIARDYEDLGLPILDLINEGNIGLMKAVERFDPSKGGKLSTYGSWWIKQSIRRALANQGKTVRLPVHMADKLYHFGLAKVRLQEKLGDREPTDEELAEELGKPVEVVRKTKQALLRPIYLDAAAFDDEEGISLVELFADERAPDPSEQFENRSHLKHLREELGRLPDRERTILQLRFGLNGGDEQTLEEVGKRFEVTRERVRQIQNLAIDKLRARLEGVPLKPVRRKRLLKKP